MFCERPSWTESLGTLKHHQANRSTIVGRQSVITSRFRGFLSLVALMILPLQLVAQEESDYQIIVPDQQLITGSLSLSTDYRSSNQDYAPSGANTYGSLVVEHQFSSGRIPVDFTFSTQKDLRGDPYLRFGVHPEFFKGAVRLHGGDFYPEGTSLIVGGASLFGGGIDVEAGNIRGGAWYGTIDRPTTFGSDTLSSEPSRIGLGARIGFGSNDKGFVDFSLTHIIDDSVSAVDSPLLAQENTIAGTEFFLPLFSNKLTIEGEGAIAAWSSDIEAGELESGLPFFTARESSQFDGAARFGVRYAPSWNVAVGLSGRWIGPGYVTLTQPYMQNDLFEATLSPSLTLFDGRLYTNGSIGVQWDNLRNTKEGTTRELVGSFFASMQTTDWLDLSLSYNNYGSSSDHANDTVRYGYLSRSLTFSPTAYWNGLGGSNIGSISLSLQNGKTRNVGGSFSESSVASLQGTWALAFPSLLSLTTGFGYSTTDANGTAIDVISANETVSHSFLEGKLNGGITFGASHYQNDGGTSLDLSGTLSYDLGRPGILSFVLSNSLDKGFGGQNRSSRELYGALRYGMQL